MCDWIFDLPLWLVGPGLVVLLGGFAVLGVLFVRARILPRLRPEPETSEFISTMVHTIMVFYALVVALIAVNVFETYAECSKIVSTEATALAMLYRDVQSFPEPISTTLKDDLRFYVERTIHESWPLQRKGQIPSGGVARMNKMQADLASFEPATEGQKALLVEVWRAYNHVVESRRARLDEVNAGLPDVLWLVVALGAMISLCSAFFFHVVDVRLHLLLITMLAAFIATVIFVVIAMDRPFRGDLGISAEHYELIYDQVMKK